jgi:hypothetical protein
MSSYAHRVGYTGTGVSGMFLEVNVDLFMQKFNSLF